MIVLVTASNETVAGTGTLDPPGMSVTVLVLTVTGSSSSLTVAVTVTPTATLVALEPGKCSVI